MPAPSGPPVAASAVWARKHRQLRLLFLCLLGDFDSCQRRLDQRQRPFLL